MTAAIDILNAIDQAGIRLSIGDSSTLKCSGDQSAVAQWLPEIKAHKADLIALLTDAANEPATGIRYASAEQLADDRRTCTQCRNLASNGRCMAASRGELPLTSSKYEPFADKLERCIGYLPGSDDADQRPGRERWQHLHRRLWATMEGAR